MVTHRSGAAAQPAPRARLARWQTWLALVGILLIAAHFRILSLHSWDGDSYLHPDERFIVYTIYNLRVPHSLGDYLKSACAVDGQVPSPSRTVDLAGRELGPADYEPSLESGCNTLNPRSYGWSRFFVYGTLPTSLTRLVAELRQSWTQPDAGEIVSPSDIRNTGRTLSTLFDLGSVLLTFLIARRLYGERAGLLAGLLYALSAFPAQLAHFATVDATTGFFVLLSAYWAIRAAQDGGVPTFLMLGGAIGGAMASRITMATLGMLAMLAVAVRIWGPWLTRAPIEQRPSLAQQARLVILLLISGLVALISFRLLAPDSFIGTSFFDIRPDKRFVESITSVSGYVSGKIDAPFSQQWANRTPFLFPLSNMIIWGMGAPLGVAAWVAWLIALWRIVRRRDLTSLIPVVWIGFYFAWQGGQFGMTMRYYALLYGLLIALAAGALVRLWGWRAGGARWARAIRFGVPGLVLLGTGLWALAFSAIYANPHSRIAASRWIYENIPPGATITSEIWDDVLPLGEDGQNPNQYVIIKTAPYQEDDLVKYTGYIANDGVQVVGLLDQLDQADYVILTSNRVYGSALRLPMRYPALTRYYHYLFNGDLGFELAADIHSYPTLFGVEIPDQGAEEAFSVYDHPRVLIFRKTLSYTRENALRLITSDIAWGEIHKIPTVKVRQVPTALRLTDTQWPSYAAAGTWSKLFALSPIMERAPWLPWLLVLELLGLAAFALLFRPLRSLADRGFAIAKLLGLLLVAYLAWLLGSWHWAPFTPQTVWLCSAPLLLLGGVAGWAQRAELAAFWRMRRGALLTAEGLFLVAFLGFVVLRALNPDLWHPARGGEKPMDLAFLTATLKSAAFPPYDPWFAGGYINYYYFGYVLVGTLTHLTGIVPNVAYNLAVPTLFALTALGAWGVAYNLAAPQIDGQPGAPLWRRLERRAAAAGLVAALFVAVVGNLAQAYWLLPGTANPAQPRPAGLSSYAAQQWANGRAEWAFWDATRTAAYALNEGLINEFPFFTFLFGDLHAHMIALPLGLLVLGLLVAVARGARGRPQITAALLLGLTLGALNATNTWDYPGYLGMALMTFALLAWSSVRAGLGGREAIRTLLLRAALAVGAAWLLFLPFTRSFATDYAGLEIWAGARTPSSEILKISGLWVFTLASAGALIYHRAGRLGRIPMLAIMLALALLVGITVWVGGNALIVLGLLIGGALMIFFDLGVYQQPAGGSTPTPEVGLRTLLLVVWGLCGFGLLLVPELVVAKGDIGRMNTLFKFGMQSWTILAVVSAVGLVWAWQRLSRGALAWAWRAAAALLVGAALLYPAIATPARLADRFDTTIGPTLDGMAFMSAGGWGENNQRFSFVEDAQAIAWMRANIEGTPIVLEAQTEGYRWGGRIATYTGLPTLLGWPWHETQQRSVADIGPILESRKFVIQQIYTAPNPAEALRTLQLYGIEYVVVGQLERALYDPAGLARLETLAQSGALREVYSQGQTRIYRVPKTRQSPAVLTTTMQAIPPDGSATTPPSMLGMRVGDLPASDPYPQLGRASRAEQFLALQLWLLAWLVLLLLGAPIAALVFGGAGHRRVAWHDGGYAWARLVGLVLAGYLVWLPTSAGVWQYNRLGLGLGLGLLALLNIAALYRIGGTGEVSGRSRSAATTLRVAGLRLRSGGARVWSHYWEHRREILQVEAVALAAFLLLLALRALNPDLWHPYWGGEKPFEFGLLNATLRSPVMPPYSPFFSDGTINYYYYGLFLMSLAIKATGIAPSVAFNLIVPTLFGLFASGIFALGARISGRRWVGLAAVALVALAGNLAAPFRVGWSAGIGPVLRALEAGPAGFGKALDSWFVGPSRVIPNTINEFPLWGFLFADLHPHLIAMPITILAIALAWELLQRSHDRPADGAGGARALISPAGAAWCAAALAAITLGTLAVTNSWDFPTYALLIGGALIGARWRRGGGWAARAGGILTGALLAGAVAGAGLGLFLPFFQRFSSQVGGIGAVKTPTDLRDLLLVVGLPLAILVPTILASAWRLLRVQPAAPARPAEALGFIARPLQIAQIPQALVLVAGGVVMLAVALAVVPLPLAIPAPPSTRAWLAILLLACAPILLNRRVASASWFVAWLSAVALAVALGMEVVFVRDHLAGGDWYRMNTVFKFGLQVWILLGLAAALALPGVARTLRQSGLIAQAVGWWALAMLAALALVFPLAGIPSRTAYRFEQSPVPTLDGLAFLETSGYHVFPQYLGLAEGSFTPTYVDLRSDAAAIRWLNEHVQGAPVVIQSSAEFYRLYGVRVAANTGLPTVVSPLHESEQREPTLVFERDRDVQLFYRTTDEAEALRLIGDYRIGYVYVGPIERIVYGVDGLAKFDQMARPGGPLLVAYQNPGVTIYRVDPIAYDLARTTAAEVPPAPAERRREASLAALEQRLADEPDNLSVAWQLVQRYAELGQFDRAALALEPFAQRLPSDIGVQHLYGDMLNQAGRQGDAEQAYRRAAEASPKAPNYVKLATALIAWGRSEEAEAVLAKAIDDQPLLGDPYYYLGTIAEQREQRDRAEQLYRRYLELAPPGDPLRGDAEKALRRIAE